MTPFSLALVLRFSSVHSLSCVQFFATPRNTGRISRTVMTALSMVLKDRNGPRFLFFLGGLCYIIQEEAVAVYAF